MPNLYTLSSPLVIENANGNIYRAIREDETSFKAFGEAYSSLIFYKSIKAWKKHKLMTLNLVVPVGMVGFVFTDGSGIFEYEAIGEENYKRLTVPPGCWFGFKGLSKKANLVLNISDMIHDDKEVDRVEVDRFNFNWDLL